MLPAAGLLAFTQMADAHYPGIEGTAECVDVTAKVTIYVESWQTTESARRANNNIAVLWDGVTVASRAFTAANGYKFTIELTAPADGAVHALKAVAVDPFGPNGEFDFQGTSRENTVTLPKSCVVATTTAAPTTTAPATTTTEQKVVTSVLGTTVTRVDVATPVEVLPRFAG